MSQSIIVKCSSRRVLHNNDHRVGCMRMKSPSVYMMRCYQLVTAANELTDFIADEAEPVIFIILFKIFHALISCWSLLSVHVSCDHNKKSRVTHAVMPSFCETPCPDSCICFILLAGATDQCSVVTECTPTDLTSCLCGRCS
jgi:hypothetical protein